MMKLKVATARPKEIIRKEITMNGVAAGEGASRAPTITSKYPTDAQIHFATDTEERQTTQMQSAWFREKNVKALGPVASVTTTETAEAVVQ